MSASHLKRSFARQGNSRANSTRSNHVSDQYTRNDEHTSLLSRHPLYLDQRSWGGYATWKLGKISKLVIQNIWLLLSYNYVNALLIVLPFAFVSHLFGWHALAVFILNFLAIIPLQSLIVYASEELSLPLGQVLGGLFNALFGNTTELVICIVALEQNEYQIVQACLLGSAFWNMLLVPGVCFFAGGLRYAHQNFDDRIVSTMLFPTVASISTLIAPTALSLVTAGTVEKQSYSASLSLGYAAVLLLLHAANLTFQLATHSNVFDEFGTWDEDVDIMEEEMLETESRDPSVKNWRNAFTLLATLVLLTFCARNLIRTIPAVIEISGLHHTFIGFVFLPCLGNTADLFTAATVAYKSNISLALGVCTGGIMQTVLFVTPVLVIIGAASKHPLTLNFGTQEIAAILFATVLLVAFLQKGSSTYLDGVLCLGFYFITMITFAAMPAEVHSSV